MNRLLLFALFAASSVAWAETAAEPKRTRVYAGVYLQDVSAFDLKEGRFAADLHVWAKWAGDPEPPPLVFENGEVATREEVSRESDESWHSARWRVQGTFRGTFPLHDFPFDKQTLRIVLSLPASYGELVPDLAASGTQSEFSVTGWLFEPFFEAERKTTILATDLGAIAGEGTPQTIETISFNVEIARPFAAYVVKFLLPLGIIVVMALLAAFVPPVEIGVRSGIGVTALLSCIAFHFTQADSLPDVSYLVAADKLFLGSYFLILGTLVGTVAVFRIRVAAETLARRIDIATWVAIPALAFASIFYLLGPGTGTHAEAAAPAAATATPAPLVSSRTELRVGVTLLPKMFNTQGLTSLLRRGMMVEDAAGELQPHLAERAPSLTNELVRFLPDGGMRVRWILRRELRFSDGSPITPAEIVATLESNPNSDRVSMKVVDDRTVDIRYKNRDPRMLRGFVVRTTASIAASKEDMLPTEPGDGPYVLQTVDEGKSAVFVRNAHFAGARPPIETIRVKVFASGEEATRALLAGELDLVAAAGTDAIKLVAGVENVRPVAMPSGTLNFLQPDLTLPALADVRVRRAILHSVDRTKLAFALAGSEGRQADTFRSDDEPDYAADVAKYPFDPKLARALLREAGYPSLTLPVFHTDLKAGTPGERGMSLLVESAAACGITLERKVVKSALEVWQKGGHGGLVFFPRRDTGTMSIYWNVPWKERWDGDARHAAFGDAQAALIERWRLTLFDERRTILSRRLQRDWSEKLPLLPLTWGQTRHLLRSDLRGFEPSSLSLFWNAEELRFAPAVTTTSGTAAP